MRGRRRRWVVGALAFITLAAFFAARMVDEPLRRRVEAGMNAALSQSAGTPGRTGIRAGGAPARVVGHT